ncbi:cysteine--tRNA ligase [Candidatus Sumerlaeota bacterium]|nr:cysteine--tRNA ligase [Candidatus Sumerlaeota bacterium]
MKVQLYNTASRSVEEFAPIHPPEARIYSCGMTVYSFAHIGHLKTYIASDILRRTLEFAGYEVRHVMNVTDVGHMTSDEDEGDDKMDVGAKKEGLSPWELARKYEEHFFNTIREVNIIRPQVICRATEHIQEQIELIQRLEKNGFTYITPAGVVFDSNKFDRYADFARLQLDGNIENFRTAADPDRKSPQDFSLWVLNKPNHVMQWDSPWGRGYPGWHIECSAMAMRYLGEELDIHTGGIDHIPVHHTNEIAQSECATGKTFARFWVHSAFLNVDGTKMSKSLGNLYTLDDCRAKGFTPLALRYFFLQSSYRKPINFTWDALEAAQTALAKIWEFCSELPAPSVEPLEDYLSEFRAALYDDLNTSAALAVVHKLIKSDADPAAKARTLFKMDDVLALDLATSRTRLNDLRTMRGATQDSEQKALELAQQRQELRKQKNFAEADRLRGEIEALGFTVMDTPAGPQVKPLG